MANLDARGTVKFCAAGGKQRSEWRVVGQVLRDECRGPLGRGGQRAEEGTVFGVGGGHVKPRLPQWSLVVTEEGEHIAGAARHVGTKRQLTPTFQLPKEAPFQPDGAGRVRVCEGLHKRE